MNKIKGFCLLLIIIFSITGVCFAQNAVQLGEDIYGENAFDWSAFSVSLSASGDRVAIGAIWNEGHSSGTGQVRVYELNTDQWIQLGEDIDGENSGDLSGWSVALSDSGTRVAVGSWLNAGNGFRAGHARVFEFDDLTWEQIGPDIDGEFAEDFAGYAVSLSADGNHVAVGAPGNDDGGDRAGQVRVFELQSGNWLQMGEDIIGEAAEDASGRSVSLSADGTVIAIGADGNDSSATNSGHVRVYAFSNGVWTQMGADIDGEGEEDRFGDSVSISYDGSIVAIGAPQNSESGSSAGHVRVFGFNGANWVQIGDDIDGEAAEDQSGLSVSLSADGSRLAIGAPENDGSASNSGHARVFEYRDGVWAQLGQDIEGDAENDQSGTSVSLSANGMRIAIGAPINDGNGTESGQLRVFSVAGLFSGVFAIPVMGSFSSVILLVLLLLTAAIFKQKFE